jgi:magnesium-transporting ATPase (P-type)
MLLFNVVLTSLPVISLGVFEQDVSSEICLQVYDRTSNIFLTLLVMRNYACLELKLKLGPGI